MTREQAIKQAEKRWGKQAAWRVGSSRSSSEQRAERRTRLLALRAERETLEKAWQERLNAMPEYQEYTAKRKALIAAIRTVDFVDYYKFLVGENLGFAFEVKGHGDTWEEAFANADGRSPA